MVLIYRHAALKPEVYHCPTVKRIRSFLENILRICSLFRYYLSCVCISQRSWGLTQNLLELSRHCIVESLRRRAPLTMFKTKIRIIFIIFSILIGFSLDSWSVRWRCGRKRCSSLGRRSNFRGAVYHCRVSFSLILIQLYSMLISASFLWLTKYHRILMCLIARFGIINLFYAFGHEQSKVAW